MSPSPDYHRAFDPSAEFTNWLGTFRCVTRQIGSLQVPSGRIVAGDPVVDLSPTPFTTVVPAGEYPVVIAIAMLSSKHGTNEAIACAMVRFSDAVPQRWTMATTETQDVTRLKEGEIFGYGVDAGVGCFASLEAALALQKRMDADEGYADVIFDQADKVHTFTHDPAGIIPRPSGKANVVPFLSGFYPSYWGHDGAGNPVCLITDFGLVGPDPDEDAEA